jgi:MYXO-CTERM domain-containing protein
MWLHRRTAHLLLLLLPAMAGLLPSRAEAAGDVPGLPCASARLVKDINPGGAGSNPNALVDVGGTLYFTASDGSTGPQLWKSNGTLAGTERVAVGLWPPNASLEYLTAVGGRLYFMASYNDVRELWKSDGTSTQRLVTLPNMQKVEPEMSVLNGDLFFLGETASNLIELWVSEGVSGATHTVRVNPSDNFNPSQLTVFNGELYFKAEDATAGIELWKTGGPNVPPTRVADIWKEGGSDPESLEVMGDWLYFFASDGSGTNKGLWKTQGTEASTLPVPSDLGSEDFSDRGNLVAAGRHLFFTVNKGAEFGRELWKSDGTRVELVKDIKPGTTGSSPEQLIVVGETLFFVITDNSQRQLWKSDGTRDGTVRVQNFLPEKTAPSSLNLAVGPGVLLAEVNDQLWGSELWKVDGTGGYRLTDLAPGGGSSTPSKMTVSGTHLFFVATQQGAGEELFALSLKEVDCFKPQLTCPGPQAVEATSASGAFFISPPAVVFDDAIAGLSLSYNRRLDDTFPIRSTDIIATAKDAAGHETTCSFEVKVQDTTPPLLVCPQVVRQEATSPAETPVFYSLGLSDAVSASFQLDYGSKLPNGSAPRSGSFFPEGTTRVEITATETRSQGQGANLSSKCAFDVIVEDTRGPRLTCPEDVVMIAQSAAPVTASYAVFPVDVHPIAQVSYSHEPDEYLFPVGTTPVTVTATDTRDNSSSCTFQVRHVDPEGPAIACPGPQQAVATGPEGASVDFPAADAEDNLAPPTVSYSHEPGSTFPVGETIVTAEARDVGGNTAACTFPVTVTASAESSSGCGCGAGSSGGSLGWLMLALTTLWARRRVGRVGR